jgi:hypothetical protein
MAPFPPRADEGPDWGTLLEGFPKASSTGPNRSESVSVKLCLSVDAIFEVWASNNWPKRSLLPQRCSDSTQSSEVTGRPPIRHAKFFWNLSKYIFFAAESIEFVIS